MKTKSQNPYSVGNSSIDGRGVISKTIAINFPSRIIIITSWLAPLFGWHEGISLLIRGSTGGNRSFVLVGFGLILLPALFTIYVAVKSYRYAGWKGLGLTGIWVMIGYCINMFVF